MFKDVGFQPPVFSAVTLFTVTHKKFCFSCVFNNSYIETTVDKNITNKTLKNNIRVTP